MFHPNITLKMKAFLLIALSCTKISPAALQSTSSRAYRETQLDADATPRPPQSRVSEAETKERAGERVIFSGQAPAAPRNIDSKRQAAAIVTEHAGGRHTQPTRFSFADANDLYAQLPKSSPKDLITLYLLSPDDIVIRSEQQEKEEQDKLQEEKNDDQAAGLLDEVEEAKRANDVVIAKKITLSDKGTRKKKQLEGMNYHDFVIHQHLVKLTPAVMHDQQKIRELSPAQVALILDLYDLKDPKIRPARFMNEQVELPEAQAKVFLSLPLFIQENLMRNYPIGINADHVVNRNSKEFLPALRRITPIKKPLSQEELKQDAANPDLLNQAEIDHLQKLTFEQLGLLREMYRVRGTVMKIDDYAYEFVSLPKDLQNLLLNNYPMITPLGWWSWGKAMLQKHPKRAGAIAVVATAGGATVYYLGAAKVMAGATAIGGKIITAKKAQQATVVLAALGTAALVIDGRPKNQVRG